MTVDYPAFGAALRMRRLMMRYTQDQVSQQLGGIVSSPTISRVEAGLGEPTLRSYLALCAWLDISPMLYVRGWQALRADASAARRTVTVPAGQAAGRVGRPK